jgi:hypothetical protein
MRRQYISMRQSLDRARTRDVSHSQLQYSIIAQLDEYLV